MITYPNFKINIGLYITEKRADSFHNIETIFYPLKECCDKLEITSLSAGETQMTVLNSDTVTADAENLCLKAYYLLKQDYALPPVSITLTKNIPVGAGLGGGSSDAAFTLKMINTIFDLKLSDSVLKKYAAQLGSDVPFFIDNAPAYATGKGEVLTPIHLDLSHKVFTVVKPSFSISTAEAYRSVNPQFPALSLKEAIALPLDQWKEHIKNDFEKSLCKKYPSLQEIKALLYEKGADYVSLSGSGSALFAIADKKIDVGFDAQMMQI